ncbi:MAG TPA: hypothetical protein VFW78_05585 [Bacteroidia bacterium]|nr:hypothetical protein [Bacteroidia bacterium]
MNKTKEIPGNTFGKVPEILLFRIISLLLIAFPVIIGLFNADSCTDWGDDFAQYLCQANVIAGNLNQLPVTCINSYSPEVKGILFSFLLTPLMGSASLIMNCKLITAFFLGMFGFQTFRFLNQITNIFTAWFFSIFLISHIETVALVNQVLPDILFAFITLTALVLYSNKHVSNKLSAFFLAGLTTGFKSAGLVLAAVFLLLTIYAFLNGSMQIKQMLKRIGLLVSGPVLIKIATLIYFNVESTDLWYIHQSVDSFTSYRITESIGIYYKSFKSLFEFEVPSLANSIIVTGTGILFVIGFVGSIVREKSVLELFFTFYLVMLMLYPDYNESFRFLFPLFPLFLWYIVKAVRIIQETVRLNVAGIVTSGLATLLVIGNLSTLRVNRPVSASICDADALELFHYLRKSVPKGNIVSCDKPWAIAWFGETQTIPLSCSLINADFKLLQNADAFSKVKTGNEIVFENNSFTLIRLNHTL